MNTPSNWSAEDDIRAFVARFGESTNYIETGEDRVWEALDELWAGLNSVIIAVARIKSLPEPDELRSASDFEWLLSVGVWIADDDSCLDVETATRLRTFIENCKSAHRTFREVVCRCDRCAEDLRLCDYIEAVDRLNETANESKAVLRFLQSRNP